MHGPVTTIKIQTSEEEQAKTNYAKDKFLQTAKEKVQTLESRRELLPREKRELNSLRNYISRRERNLKDSPTSKQVLGYKLIIVKYASKCNQCKYSLTPGDYAWWRVGGKALHCRSCFE